MASKAKTKRQLRRQKGIPNKAGFKASDEGVFLDKHGNRRIYEIALTPEGEVVSRFGAHPVQIMNIFVLLMEENTQSRAMVLSSARQYRNQKRFKAFKSLFGSLLVRLGLRKARVSQMDAKGEKPDPKLQEKIAKEKAALNNSHLKVEA